MHERDNAMMAESIEIGSMYFVLFGYEFKQDV
jgi:hypothetical protein